MVLTRENISQHTIKGGNTAYPNLEMHRSKGYLGSFVLGHKIEKYALESKGITYPARHNEAAGRTLFLVLNPVRSAQIYWLVSSHNDPRAGIDGDGSMGLLTIIKKVKAKEREVRVLMVGLDNAARPPS